MIGRKALNHLIREPLAWFFATTISIGFTSLGFLAVGFSSVSMVLNLIFTLQFIGLLLARKDLRFMYYRATFEDDVDAWRELDLEALRQVILDENAA